MKKFLFYFLGLITAISVAYAGFTVIDNLQIDWTMYVWDYDWWNFAEFEGDWGLVFTGTARVYKNQWVELWSFKVPGANPATQADLGISDAWEFTDGADEVIYSTIRAPQDMDRSVAPEFKLGRTSDSADPGDDSLQAQRQVEYLWRAMNEDLTAVAQETLTGLYTVSTITGGLSIATITGIDLPSSSDQLLLLRIKRIGSADTLGDDAYLVGFGMKYYSDKLWVGL